MERRTYTAHLIGTRILVLDPGEARELFKQGFYGKFTGVDKVRPEEVDKVERPLELSLLEALYLMEKGLLTVKKLSGEEVSLGELRELGRKLYRDFDLLYTVYRDLREMGYVVRTGLRYGTYFAVYERGPGIDHAPFLVDVMSRRSTLDPLAIVRSGRLSHSVRKRFVVACYDEGEGRVKYLVFTWFTP